MCLQGEQKIALLNLFAHLPLGKSESRNWIETIIWLIPKLEVWSCLTFFYNFFFFFLLLQVQSLVGFSFTFYTQHSKCKKPQCVFSMSSHYNLIPVDLGIADWSRGSPGLGFQVTNAFLFQCYQRLTPWEIQPTSIWFYESVTKKSWCVFKVGEKNILWSWTCFFFLPTMNINESLLSRPKHSIAQQHLTTCWVKQGKHEQGRN